jgi:flagellar hook-associated protein 2
MGRITTDVGLNTGVPIAETVEKLIAIQARPRDRLENQLALLKSQQAALVELTTLVISLQLAMRKLTVADPFTRKAVTSSRPDLLTATAGSEATPGAYQFVPVQMASTHQLLSSGLAARDQALGGGWLSFRFGGFVNEGVSLADLNGGAGVARGKIRIFDRSGASALVDLNSARTVDDVIDAINAADGISVRAVAEGDRLRLIDSSGGSGLLRVVEVSGGRTAADLGLAGINVAADTADGADIVRLFAGLDLDRLNDGAGLSIRSGLPDLDITFHNGSTLQIDFRSLAEGARQEQTLGDLLQTLNEADPARLRAEISADGDRIVLTDLTAGGGSFTVASALGGSLAEDLGLAGSTSDSTLASRRLQGGLATTLLSSLSGGSGLGQLGAIQLTDRSGASATVDLSAAETLDDVIAAINAAGIAIEARYNSARNGVALVDTSGGSGHLIVADADASAAATKLGLLVNAAVGGVNSGSLHRQVVSESTMVASYNGGKGVSKGSFLITDSAGQNSAVNLTVLNAQTIGDVIDAINGLSIGVEARINDAGDGILLVDTAGGTGTLRVEDVGAGTAAKDLRLAGTGTAAVIGGQNVQIIDGSTTFTVTLDADDTLDDLVAKINGLKAGVGAGVISDGAGSLAYHLSILSSIAGKAGELLVDGSGLGLDFSELSAAQDALLQFGVGSGSRLFSSSSNTFQDVAPGLDVTIQGESTSPVTINVKQTSEDVSIQLQLFVEQYNKLRQKLEELTFFNESDGKKGLLFGSAEALRIETELADLVTGRVLGAGKIQSLAELGISIDKEGKLSFDKTKLEARFASDPEAVKEFFSAQTVGLAHRMDQLIERLAGIDDSMLVTRGQALQRQMESIAARIDFLNERLDRSRERLLNQFYQMELIVGRIRNNLTAISQIAYIPPIFRSQNNS